MTLILGIDAAWTATEPSGVALVSNAGGPWRCLAVAPSYNSFVALAARNAVDWTVRPLASAPDPKQLLTAAQTLAGAKVDLVTVDMPVATVPFEKRRQADEVVSTEFGARHCGTHSPTKERPGAQGAAFTAAFAALGYAVATTATAVQSYPRLLEVYPHPALLTLMNADKRVPYKQSKSKTYWDKADKTQRIANLLQEYQKIEAKLHEAIGPFELPLPTLHASAELKLATLKRYEDAIDALICCWVGTLYAEGKARPLGDDTAAIWCPLG
jgi:predicted RNase H-like nuclease